MLPFLSTFLHKIDSKGRVSLPSSFRLSLKQTSDKEMVVLLPSYKHPALEGMSVDRIQKMSEAVDSLDLYSEEQTNMASALFADATLMNIDPQGRIQLKDNFIEHAGLVGEVALVGRGETFEIWHPKKLQEHLDSARAKLKEQKVSLRLHSLSSKGGANE